MSPLVDTPTWYAQLAVDGVTAALRRAGRPDYGTIVGGGGTPPPSDPDRSTLVYGTYEPDLSNTGVITGTTLTNYNSTAANTVTIPNGAVISNQHIWGDVTFSGSATITNCYLHGGLAAATGDTGILKADNTRTGIAVLTDCTLIPQTPSNARNCTLGRQYELYRCRLELGIDGVGVRSTSSAHPACDVVVKGCLIQNLSFYSDPNLSNPADPVGGHTDGTHSDCIQHQGGKNVTIVGNSLRGTSTKLPGSGDLRGKEWMTQAGWTSGACVIVQNNVDSTDTWAAVDATTLVSDNYVYGGGAGSQINIKTTAHNMVYKNNHHYRATPVGTGWSGYWIRFQSMSTTNVSGINTTPTNSNVWIDGPYAGTGMVTPRDHGVEPLG